MQPPTTCSAECLSTATTPLARRCRSLARNSKRRPLSPAHPKRNSNGLVQLSLRWAKIFFKDSTARGNSCLKFWPIAEKVSRSISIPGIPRPSSTKKNNFPKNLRPFPAKSRNSKKYYPRPSKNCKNFKMQKQRWTSIELCSWQVSSSELRLRSKPLAKSRWEEPSTLSEHAFLESSTNNRGFFFAQVTTNKTMKISLTNSTLIIKSHFDLTLFYWTQQLLHSLTVLPFFNSSI